MPNRIALLATAGLIAAIGLARAETNRLAPISSKDAASTRGPYEMGACETCHQRRDATNPGAAVRVSNDLCYECHEEFRGSAPVKMDRSVHPKNVATCTT